MSQKMVGIFLIRFLHIQTETFILMYNVKKAILPMIATRLAVFNLMIQLLLLLVNLDMQVPHHFLIPETVHPSTLPHTILTE